MRGAGVEQEPLCWDKLTTELLGAEDSIQNFNSLHGTRSDKKVFLTSTIKGTRKMKLRVSISPTQPGWALLLCL